MEGLQELNLEALMEGQEFEEALCKAVSTIPHLVFNIFRSPAQCPLTLINLPILHTQGFSQFNLTPLEVLTVIHAAQVRIGRTITEDEIKSGALKSILTDHDFQIVERVTQLTFTS